MIKLLSSTKEETLEKSVSSLPGNFHYKDLRESIIAIKTLSAVMKLLKSESQNLLVVSLSCLAALFLSIRENQNMALIARDALSPLIILAKSPALEVAENAICALANLLLDDTVSISAVTEEIILPSTRVLSDGTTLGKTQAAAAIAHLLHSRAATDGLTDCINRAGTVLSLISLLEIANDGSPAKSEALDALAFLSRLGVSSGKAQARGPLGFKALPKQKHWLATIMRSGPILVKIHASSVLGSLCKEDELRVKVLLGGCIPPFLGLLRSNSSDGQIAAAKTIYAVSQGNVRDHIGSKIFSTEGVIPVL